MGNGPSSESSSKHLESRRTEQVRDAVQHGTDAYSTIQRFFMPDDAKSTGKDVSTHTEIRHQMGADGTTVHEKVEHVTFRGAGTHTIKSDQYVVDNVSRSGGAIRTLMQKESDRPIPQPPGSPSAVPVASYEVTVDQGGGRTLEGTKYHRDDSGRLEQVKDNHSFYKPPGDAPMQTVFRERTSDINYGGDRRDFDLRDFKH